MISLLASQNPDGGWPFERGGLSWTEPTGYAVLALIAEGAIDDAIDEAVERGVRWPRAAQLPDGGWPPQPGIRRSAWMTAVAVLPGPAKLGEDAYRRGIRWIVEQTGADTDLLSRVRQFLTGNPQGYPGWPWFPGTSAWVTPTALSMLAVRKGARWAELPQIPARLDMGAAYLLAHVCRDGGWNHGASSALGYGARSYPETTGVALLALSGKDAPVIRKAVLLARAKLPTCQSSEAESWLRLGLLAHGQLPLNAPLPVSPARTVQNAALALLASAALAGRNAFLE
jgi:hypothetical protein